MEIAISVSFPAVLACKATPEIEGSLCDEGSRAFLGNYTGILVVTFGPPFWSLEVWRLSKALVGHVEVTILDASNEPCAEPPG